MKKIRQAQPSEAAWSQRLLDLQEAVDRLNGIMLKEAIHEPLPHGSTLELAVLVDPSDVSSQKKSNTFSIFPGQTLGAALERFDKQEE